MEPYVNDSLVAIGAIVDVTEIAEAPTVQGLIDGVAVQSEWAWVNKHDPRIYYPWLIKTWIAQVILVVAYFSVCLVLVKSKDVH